MRMIKTVLAGLGAMGAAKMAAAQDAGANLPHVGKPVDAGLGFQPAVTELMRDIVFLDTLILWIITVICIFVIGLLAWVVIRYREKANPHPATFTHNSAIEVTWTVVPIIILIVIGAFSLPVLFKQLRIPVADITIKATGHQWYWTHEYVDEGFGFDSFLLPRDQLAAKGYKPDEYLLATDNAVVLPVGKTVVVRVTADDVIHAWTIPAFGVKQDGVPGRIAELWFKAEKEGVYFGQCSELCGKDHAYMPITVKVVSQAAYATWLEAAKAEHAGIAAPVTLASN